MLPEGQVFVDMKISSKFDNPVNFPKNRTFTTNYFINLSFSVKQFDTYNHLGARLKLEHSSINVHRFRHLLGPNYDDLHILQYLEYGFPLGLIEDFVLKPILRNHSSSYDYFSHIDKFLVKELSAGGITGPFLSSPYETLMVSPLMTAVKKPGSRRAIFDASFSEFSLNFNTPEKIYIGEMCKFSFPRVDDFVSFILNLG